MRRKIVLLLTDGILEPNPLDATYAPWHLQYRVDVTGKSRARRNEIYQQEYRDRLSPMARRIIFDTLLPQLREQHVEIFTVALGPNTDRAFLEQLAETTSQHAVEVHAFHAARATDLVETFTQILPYWTDKTILQAEQGSIDPGTTQSIFLDEFVHDPLALTLIDGEGTFYVRTSEGTRALLLEGTLDVLELFELAQQPPATWNYGFESGDGTYRTLWLGKNVLRLLVEGLQRQYVYGDTVDVVAELRVGDENASPFLSPGARIVANLTETEEAGGAFQQPLVPEENLYRLRYFPPRAGAYLVNLVAYARDRQGRDILPRPSITYQFEVLPNFFVTPEQLNFGDAGGGHEIVRDIEIHSGLASSSTVTISGQITQSSRKGLADGTLTALPEIAEFQLTVAPGSVQLAQVTLRLPDGVAWGDFEGIILVESSSGDGDEVAFRVHVPSLWEKMRVPLLMLILGGLVVLAYLIYVGGLRVRPSGTLIPLTVPTGSEILSTIKLGQVRRGFFTRHLNWRKNLLRIGRDHAEIELDQLPPGLRAELSFHRWGDNYIRNRSPEPFEHSIFIEEPDMGRFERKPGNSLVLKHKSTIELGEYTFRYENTR